MDNPCYQNCTERSATCHGTCQRYKDWAKAERERKKKLREARDKETDVEDYIAGVSARIKRTQHRRRK